MASQVISKTAHHQFHFWAFWKEFM